MFNLVLACWHICPRLPTPLWYAPLLIIIIFIISLAPFLWRRRRRCCRLKINSNLTLMLICKHFPSPSFHLIILSLTLSVSRLLFSCCLWRYDGRLLFCDVLYATRRTESSGCSAQCENAEWGKLFSLSFYLPILICIFLNFHIICDIYCWQLPCL